jgi:hypothetical protein
VGLVLTGWLAACGSPAVDGPDEDAGGPPAEERHAPADDAGGATPSSATTGTVGDGSTGTGSSSGGGAPSGVTTGTGGSPADDGGAAGPAGGPGRDSPAGPSGDGGGAGTDADDGYGWDLPFGDQTVSINEDVLYRIIDRGACDDAQAYLDEQWSTLRHPRAVLLYQAAIDLCRGDVGSARQTFGRAESAYGWAGVARPYLDCNVYQTAKSVFEQQPPSGFACPEGDAPPWPVDDPAARVDPRLAP